MKKSAAKNDPPMATDKDKRTLIVPDTNVIVSAGTTLESPPTEIIEAWRSGEIAVATSEPILSEVADVLTRPYFRSVAGWSQSRIDKYMDEFRQSAKIVPGITPVQVSPDRDDDMLFSCAVEAEAHYIVSGDERHVLSVGSYKGIQTISPRDFVDVILQPLKQAA